MYASGAYPSGPIPNNGVVIARDSLDVYIITNSSVYLDNSFLTYARSRRDVRFNSRFRPGVARVYTYDNHLGEGVYTAHVRGANGTFLNLNVGLYSSTFSGELDRVLHRSSHLLFITYLYGNRFSILQGLFLVSMLLV